MARPKKNGTYLNVCIETPIYERLENFCKDAGHTKTVAVERALISYFDEYEEMKKKLKELESNQDKWEIHAGENQARLKWDEVSPTIDTRFDASSNGTNNHPFLHRAITPREAARIQSFDDKFVFEGSKVYIRKQIGNAVPPLLAKAIADQIAEGFGLEE